MLLTIDNSDGAGARDYTGALDRESPPLIRRTLNAPATIEMQLRIQDPQLPIPAAGARVRVLTSGGMALFTGYVAGSPSFDYLGWGMSGPIYRLHLAATGDELLLDRKRLPVRSPFVGRFAGDILKQITSDLLPGVLDTTAVQPLDRVTPYAADRAKSWSEHAQELALRARAAYHVEDGAVTFSAIGAKTHVISEADQTLAPEGLTFSITPPAANDITVLGPQEPTAYVTDYFAADGTVTTFVPSQTPFLLPGETFLDEAYLDPALNPTRWQLVDPTHAISLAASKLQVDGGTGTSGQTLLRFVEKVELAGAVKLQHGSATFNANSSGVLGGLYSGGFDAADCLAGFLIAPGATQPTITALLNGVALGAPFATVAGRSYALATRIFSQELRRTQQPYHSSAHPASSPLGGADVAAAVRAVLELTETDPASPGTSVSAALFDGFIANAPTLADYAVVNAAQMNCALSITHIVQGTAAMVRSALPGADFQALHVGPVAQDNDCELVPGPQLRFFERHVPVFQERIVLSYRGGGQAVARVVDATSVASLQQPNDDGMRSTVRSVGSPPPFSSVDCENAALAMLDDTVAAGCAGHYIAWSDRLPNGDVRPGDALRLDVPSRTAQFTCIVRTADLSLADLEFDRVRYRIGFANEAALPLALRSTPAPRRQVLLLPVHDVGGVEVFIASLPDAQIFSFGSGVITVDAGAAPPSGGGFEVRSSDNGWGPGDTANLVGRFTTQQFTVPRTTRIADYFVRAYDGSTPPRYSQYSAALHTNYPV